MPNLPSPINTPRWVDLRGRQAGFWAFVLNRLSALGLTFYLGLHLVVLHRLTQGAQAYNDFVAFSKTPWMKLGEIILIFAVAFHGLNGLRLTLHAFNLGTQQPKKLLAIVTIITLLITTAFAMRLFAE